MFKPNFRLSWAALAAAAMVAACGGGGGGSDTAGTPASTTDVPASAQQSTSGLLAYVNQLVGSTSDTSEPLVVGTATLPADDTAEAN